MSAASDQASDQAEGAVPISEQSSSRAARVPANGSRRRVRTKLPAHVARAIGPSPARASAPDPAAWLPLPEDLHALPPIEVLLADADAPEVDAAEPVIDLAALEALVSPSPARSEPHDAAAWLPLPDDVHVLPPVDELLDPHPDVQAAIIAEAEAVVRDAMEAAKATAAPSPARAVPHDPDAWLPLPVVDELPAVHELVAPASEPDGHRRRRARTKLARRGRPVFVALLAAATVVGGAWVGSQLVAPGGSKVSLLVDGSRRAIRTDATTVGGLLARRHVTMGPGDSVQPARSASLYDGMRIAVLRAFPVTVDTDGVVRTVRTSVHDTTDLARELHLGKLVELRGAAGVLHAGDTVTFRTRHGGSLALDGQHVAFDSPSLNVSELLDSYHVVLVGQDYVTPAAATALTDGMAVTVVRVGTKTVPETRVVHFSEVRRPDPNLPIGQTKEVQAGRNGTETVTYLERVENGAGTSDRRIVSVVPAIAPVPHVIAYGTGADWHWDALAHCESGGRWDTIDAGPDGYDGGLGIYRGTWRAFGGTEFAENAGLATREQQIIVGMRIFAKYGWEPWGCARNVLHWT